MSSSRPPDTGTESPEKTRLSARSDARLYAYSRPISQPPHIALGFDEQGRARTESLLLTGWFECAEEHWLRHHQLDLTYAQYNARTQRFECCLVSLENFEILQDLQLHGRFETPYYLTYSLGQLHFLETQPLPGRTDAPRPLLPEWAYLLSPTPEARKRLNAWLEQRQKARHLQVVR